MQITDVGPHVIPSRRARSSHGNGIQVSHTQHADEATPASSLNSLVQCSDALETSSPRLPSHVVMHRYLFGEGVPQSCEKALLYYEYAANIAANQVRLSAPSELVHVCSDCVVYSATLHCLEL